MINEGIFREYDIRGIAGRDLDRQVAALIGRALVEFIGETNPGLRCLSVGRDVRHSSAELAAGVVEGMTSSGVDVIDLGVCPTPLQYFSLFQLPVDGGIMVTGSHNPPEYNGFKVSVGKDTIHGRDIQKLKEIILKGRQPRSAPTGTVDTCDIVNRYQEFMIREFAYLADPAYRRLVVVVDAGNGTAGTVAPPILERLGCDVVPLYCEPDGSFPNHHPDPTVVAYIRDLIRVTRERGADMGVGYDGDADRIGVVGRDGSVIWGDQLMIVLARELLKEHPGATVIGDVKCSQLMFDDIGRHGGKALMWKTGHSLVKQKMKDEAALLAGEFSGHIFIGDRYFGYDDAIYTTLRLVEIMKRTSRDIRALLADVPSMSFTPEIRIECAEETKRKAVERVVQRFLGYRDTGGSPHSILGLQTIDGVRVTFEKGWGLIRMSNTQPVVVMRVEAADEELLASYRSFIEAEFREVLAEID